MEVTTLITTRPFPPLPLEVVELLELGWPPNPMPVIYDVSFIIAVFA